jgi:hypothetical protein
MAIECGAERATRRSRPVLNAAGWIGNFALACSQERKKVAIDVRVGVRPHMCALGHASHHVRAKEAEFLCDNMHVTSCAVDSLTAGFQWICCWLFEFVCSSRISPGRRQQGPSTNRRAPWPSSNSIGCLALSHLHPSTQAHAPATEPECSVPGQPNIARSLALRWSLAVWASFYSISIPTLSISLLIILLSPCITIRRV